MALLISDPVMRAYPAEMRFLLQVRFAFGALLVPCLYLAITWWGMLGAIAVPVAIIFFERIVVMYRVARILGAGRQDLHHFGSVGKISAAAAVAAVVCAAARCLALGNHPLYILGVSGILFCVAYVAALFAMGVPTTDESAVIRRKIGSLRRALSNA
jgi:hypothetical protein